jgi:hypothetical protein
MKFTEQERDFLKQEFADLCHAAINSMITAGSFVRAIDRIEQIVSERLTIKPYHEHGNSVASDRTEPGESGQSADEIIRHDCYHEDPLSPVLVITKDHALQAMHTYASQVCAYKEREMGLLKNELAKAKEEIEKSHMDKIYSIHDLKSELSAANESLTVMVRKNAELEKELEFKRLA